MTDRRKDIVAMVGLLSALGISVFHADWVAAQIPDEPGWKLSFHDEFDGPNVDTSVWNNITLKDSYNNEKQYYRPEQASIVNGNLRITATNQPLDGKAYRSARLESKTAFPAGRFEARMDLPSTQGMWPAFWLNANAVQWPLGGEIDILENKGAEPNRVSSAFHWQKNPGTCCDQHQYVSKPYQPTPAVNFQAAMHTYAVEWEVTSPTVAQLRFYVDDVLYQTVDQTSAMSAANFSTPKNIILNLAVGGDFGGDPNGTTTFPQNLDVDYVRVWVKQTGLSGDFNGDGKVDAADYSVWRDSVGQSGLNLPADGSGNGSVGPEDYNLWLANFGNPPGAGGGGTAVTSVPEPATAVPLGICLLLAYLQRLAGAAASQETTAP